MRIWYSDGYLVRHGTVRFCDVLSVNMLWFYGVPGVRLSCETWHGLFCNMLSVNVLWFCGVPGMQSLWRTWHSVILQCAISERIIILWCARCHIWNADLERLEVKMCRNFRTACEDPDEQFIQKAVERRSGCQYFLWVLAKIYMHRHFCDNATYVWTHVFRAIL